MQTPITMAVLVLTIIYSIRGFNNSSVLDQMLFSPYQCTQEGKWYKLFSHGFVHADYMHLFMNMYVLCLFGMQLESVFMPAFFGAKSSVLYGFLYLGGMVFATLPSFKKHYDNPYYRSLGASGAVSAIVFAWILLNPLGQMGLIFLPGIYLPGFVFGALYLWYESYMDKKQQGRIAHDAHIWGAVFGVLVMVVFDYNVLIYFVSNIKEYIINF